MANILYIFGAIVLLGVMVAVHEFGHFIAGRACGIGVVEFSIGFGPKLLGWRRGETDYSLRIIPLGGYCKFLGEDEDNPAPNAMNRQPVWKRMLTVASGPVMNFVLAYAAIVVYLLAFGVLQNVPVVVGFTEGVDVAQTAGMRVGDVIVEAMGEEITRDLNGIQRLQQIIGAAEENQPVPIAIEREGERIVLSVTPQLTQEGARQIGILMGAENRRLSMPSAIKTSGVVTLRYATLLLDGLKQLFTTPEALENTAGPVGIVSMVSTGIQSGWDAVLNLLAIISINLGIMNLLPLPALDGGRLVFLLVELVRGKPVDPEREGWVHAIGMLLLLGFILVVTWNDIMRLIGR